MDNGKASTVYVYMSTMICPSSEHTLNNPLEMHEQSFLSSCLKPKSFNQSLTVESHFLPRLRGLKSSRKRRKAKLDVIGLKPILDRDSWNFEVSLHTPVEWEAIEIPPKHFTIKPSRGIQINQTLRVAL